MSDAASTSNRESMILFKAFLERPEYIKSTPTVENQQLQSIYEFGVLGLGIDIPERQYIGALPRRGGISKYTWQCCICFHFNKTGKFISCQNPDSELCAGRLANKRRRSREVTWYNAAEKNHERCEKCSPRKFDGGGEFEWWGESRRWDPHGLSEEQKEVLREIATQAADAVVKDQVEEMIKGKVSVERDALTWQRLGEWPGGF